MATPSTNPRRRPARPADSAMSASLLDSFQAMSIQKGSTFHPASDTASTDFWDPLVSHASTTPSAVRSTTSPKSLEDLLLGAGERRVAELLNRVDQAVADKSKDALAAVLSDPAVLPEPVLEGDEVATQGSVTPTTRLRHHSHASDSGLGSSIADSADSLPLAKATGRTGTRASVSSTGNQSFSSISDAAEEERGLSKYAADQIHKHIIKPILREENLKEFHDLVKSVPERIGDKEIKNLRDLEKTLIFLAPDYSRSPSKYLRFCERTIRVLHTTVTTLHESDQRAPTDRPYTQGYFFDLVEQIRRYAMILAVTREKQAKDEKLSPTDFQEGEHVSLHGGLTHNGKAPELVRHTPDGKMVSIATGIAITESEIASAASMKRPAGIDIDDDEALRSMARRKKNAKPEIHTCELCSKEFKRPCDLTKHVKTHERPWKCTQEDCKYYEYGWPTEKERDRHVNDKHSSTPALYHCLYKPCPYTSKRESNCKQHMEKAHGWNYVRSKSNGKGRAISVTRLHQGSVPPSPSSLLHTPFTPIAPSPSIHSLSESSRRSSLAPPPFAGPSNHGTPALGTPAFTHPSPDFTGHFNMNFDFNDMANYPNFGFPVTPAMSEDQLTSSSYSGLQFDGSSFDGASPADLMFEDFNFDDFRFPEETAAPNSALAGPSSAPARQVSSLGNSFGFDGLKVDETYGDFAAAAPHEDFTLYGTHTPAIAGGGMFPSIADDTWNMDTASHTGSHFNMSNVPNLTSVNTSAALDELFPELKNH